MPYRPDVLAIHLFGAPRIERGGVPVVLDTRKAIALLAYLALSGRAHTRDALCGLLWPEQDQEHARGALRRTLSSLRKGIGDQYLEADRERIGLRREGELVIDVETFRGLTGRTDEADPVSALTKAVEIAGRGFLAGFSLRDSVNFDDWAYLEGESLQGELAEVLQRLIDAHVARGEYRQALSHGRRRLALNPLHEPAHRCLMELHAGAGERTAALTQYRQCVRVLHDELGVAPLEETTALYRSIMDGRRGPPDPSAAREAPPPETGRVVAPARERMPLVGRGREWEALTGAHRAAATDGRVVAIEGEAGIGKTRLCEEIVSHARDLGARTLIARCHQGEDLLAYGVAADALRTAIAAPAEHPAHVLAEVGRLVPEVGPPPAEPLDSPGARSRFFHAASEVLVAASAGQPAGILVIEDAHWIDEGSLDLVAYLSRRLAGRGVLLVVTWRSEDVPADHRLRRVLAELERDGRGIVLRPGRLGHGDLERIALAAGQRDDDVAARLLRETAGLPLLVAECLSAIARGDEQWDASTGMRELFAARLDALSPIARQVLGAAAVIGRPFDGDIVRRAAGRSEEEVAEALDELVRRDVVTEASHGYDIAHDALRTLSYDGIGLARRRLLHLRVAETIALHGRGRAGAGTSVIAQHYERAGRLPEAAEHHVLAGRHARSLYANAEALSHLRRAVELGHPEIADLSEEMGDLATLLGRYGEAAASYETAAAHRSSGELAGLEHKLGELHARRGDWAAAESHLRAALAGLIGDEHVERAHLHGDLALCAHARGDAAEAETLTERALALATRGDDPRTLARAHNVAGILRSAAGDPAGARRYLDVSLRLAKELDDPAARAAALNNLALAAGQEGDRAAAAEMTEEALRLCVVQGDRHREAALHNNLADLLNADGRREEAMEHLKRAATLFSEVGEEGTLEPEIWKLVRW